ncbi:hypothetical protein [Shewanella sp. NKUCC06_TVS]|uniref:hypothetical protein n=1 Tax=Shewanella sp. NKUCC06_TVS TaxID=2842128 RepID=UPI001C5B6A56|nr:hypothetical protein [Shewanella sp. NKUCC06_TVS]MBW3532836.1 hypothetical protein [Shewanella sp. NKUCC06_TVS]
MQPTSNQYYSSISRRRNKWSVLFCVQVMLASFSFVGQALAVNEFELATDAQAAKWSGYVNVGFTRNIYDSESYYAYQAYNIDSRIDYKANWGNVLFTLGGEKQTLHGKESSFYDPLLEYRTPLYALTDTVSLKGSLGVYLPAERESKLDKLQYAPRIAAYLFWSPLDNLSFYFSPRYRYNAYQYKTAGERVLVEQQLDGLLDAYWQITANWYLDISGRYRISKNYYGRRLDDQFTFAQELGWSFKPDWVLAVGHNNSGRFYNPEVGTSQGFEIYDKKSSTFYLSITKYL